MAIHGFFSELPENLKGEHAPHITAVRRAAFISLIFFRHGLYWVPDTFKCVRFLIIPDVLDAQYFRCNKLVKTKRITQMSDEEIKEEVRKTYAKVAQSTGSCCDPGTRSDYAKSLGYSVDAFPDSVTESFAGCGNPTALASLKEGEVVLDLGSGAGLDVFMAAQQVGKTGRVIGVDMTPDMIEKAKKNAEKLGLNNVEFRFGDIEALPVDAESVDVIISNCVINLAPDKAKVFQEAFRVLRTGGRMLISDIVLEATLPQETRDEVASYTSCLGGAILKEEYLQSIRDAGFTNVRIISEASFNIATSAKIEAFKPKGKFTD